MPSPCKPASLSDYSIPAVRLVGLQTAVQFRQFLSTSAHAPAYTARLASFAGTEAGRDWCQCNLEGHIDVAGYLLVSLLVAGLFWGRCFEGSHMVNQGFESRCDAFQAQCSPFV